MSTPPAETVPQPLLGASRAPASRTLVEVLAGTAALFPDEPAVDNGAEVLTYGELVEAAEEVAEALHALGVGRGDRVGVRISSGTVELYVAIGGVLLAGAAYVPVDADDPDERARTVFSEAEVVAVVGEAMTITTRGPGGTPRDAEPPQPEDDAWVIFTSGSTGTPKGVAVSHRAAAAFVDAEARWYLQDRPLGPGDRVMAGLSVGFDASCEEMWLAWRHGACLVPAPRSLVRSGMDLGPWLLANDITVVSTVPTLLLLWPVEALTRVRLLILGGETCPEEIAARFADGDREVWNTYGPTEATVVSCGVRLTAGAPVRIGLPLDGWDLAVVDGEGHPVPVGRTGELVVGGVGLARYLDPQRDAERYAPLPSLGWPRAYRTGDLVRYDGEGLVFAGRADDQVKIGGRRIELGEVDSALLSLPGVVGAAAAVRTTPAGNALLVGYVTVSEEFTAATATQALRARMPAALVPRLAVVTDLPTKTSGKVDRDALPWPVAAPEAPENELPGTAGWVQRLWADVLGAGTVAAEDDFFDLGGGSLTAAQLVGRLRGRFPEVTVADVYEHPTLGDLASALDGLTSRAAQSRRQVPPVPRRTQLGQVLLTVPLRTLTGLRWVTWTAFVANLLALAGVGWVPTMPWVWLVGGFVLFVSPPGRMALSAAGARWLLHGVGPGDYPRGGTVHLRLWLAERLADESGATKLSGAAYMRQYARALGATVGRHVDLHSLPPVTGMLTLGNRCSVEPEVDLRGHWLDGDLLHIGEITVGADARVGARSMLAPGAAVGRRAEIAPGSAVFGHVPADEAWSGAPAEPAGSARGPWDGEERPPNRPAWLGAYAAGAAAIACLPVVSLAAGLAVLLPALRAADTIGDGLRAALLWLLPAVAVTAVVLVVLMLVSVRLLGLRLREGHYPVHGLQAWRAWMVLRLLDEARTWLFPLYSSWLTPAWLRALGTRVGKDVEASTVLLVPTLTSVGDGAFLADDTLLGGYELGGGWLRVGRVKVGKHAFVGNSGMTAPGRKVPKQGLVAVLSAAPRRRHAKAGTSWLGSPPTQLRREAATSDQSRTYHPSRRLRVLRGVVEGARVLPVLLYFVLGWCAVAVIVWTAGNAGWLVAAAVSGVVLMAAGALAAGATTAAKWTLVGRLRRGNHPLWSGFVWRNELADTFVEYVAAPWFANAATGTPVLNVWLRSLGVRVGKGVWCETYWLPEADLVDLRDGASVNAGCVVQTHLFHDRVLSMDHVTLQAGATLGPHSVILPAAVLGRHATVGPVSLVMRGESVPDRTIWIGNPIRPWLEDAPAEVAS